MHEADGIGIAKMSDWEEMSRPKKRDQEKGGESVTICMRNTTGISTINDTDELMGHDSGRFHDHEHRNWPVFACC
jgi:hypothetical protein